MATSEDLPEMQTEGQADARRGVPRTNTMELLGAHRGLVLLLYLGLFATYLVLVAYATTAVVPEGFHAAVKVVAEGGSTWKGFGGLGGEDLFFSMKPLPTAISLAAIIVVLQLLFLWGGGQIRTGGSFLRRGKFLVAVAVSGIIAGFLLMGLVLLAVEFAMTRPATEIIDKWYDFWTVILIVVAAGWLFWTVVAFLRLRNTEPTSALSRILGILFTGSWLEFTLALPIDLVSRDRECPCATGSWFVLVFAVPLIFWCVGPAIYLLYLHEKREAERVPDRIWRLLIAKVRLGSGARPAGTGKPVR